ncbi:MAG: DNA recombination protein RmuC [Candidatus Thorarchaeota archaeon]
MVFVESLLVIVIIMLSLVLFRTWRRPESTGVELAISKALKDSGLERSIGMLTGLATDIRENQKSFDQMLVTPTARGAFGEISLENILKDQLPPDMFGVRKRVLDGKHPDAHIKSTVGIICIDSKFPLTNYRNMLETDGETDKKRYAKQFIIDVEKHLVKIAGDYVCPEKDSAEFAFAYIPSESVYWFLVTEGYEMLRNHTKMGVQVVSPLTLSHKIELIKAGVHAKKLSEQADKIQKDILRLASRFKGIDKLWSKLYGTHMTNVKGRSEDFDAAWKLLRDEFRRIESLSED